ncbi:hypothetical protein ScPMuIL_010737 [Solemya velum]
MATELDFGSKEEQAYQAAREFSKLFYNTFDKKRHLLNRLYLDTASLVWNGHSVTGLDNIIKFIDSLPSSEHTAENLDCQPLISEVSRGQLSIIVKVFGKVKYDNIKEPRAFNQDFLLTSQNNVWKIVSDSLRFQE